MNDWKSLLHDADRHRDPELSAADVQRIRDVILSAASDSARRNVVAWPRAFVVTATLLVMICASVLTALQRSTRTVDQWPAREIEIARTEESIQNQVARQ